MAKIGKARKCNEKENQKTAIEEDYRKLVIKYYQ